MVRAIKQIPNSAIAWVPLLVLPALLGAFGIALYPQGLGGRSLIIVSAMALAWYFLGGVIALAGLRRGLQRRRDLASLKPEMRAAGQPAFIVDDDGLILAQNGMVQALLGDVIGRRIHGILARKHADPNELWQRIDRRLTRAGVIKVDLTDERAVEIRRQPGSEVQLWHTIPRADPLPDMPVRHDDTFDDLPVPALILGSDAKVIRANPMAHELLGTEIEDGLISEVLEGPGRPLLGWVSDVSAARITGASEVLRVRRQEPEHYVQMTLKRCENGQVIAVLSDVSAMKRLEAQFVQSQKMQAIGQLAGGVAHDFNNLLTAISGHCDLLMLRHDKSDPDFADLEQINQNANRAASLVRQLLAFSRKQTLRFQMLDLRDTLADLTHLLNRLMSERISLTFQHDPQLHMIRADRLQLEQVIVNLVVNARDAMPEGGQITVTTSNFCSEPEGHEAHLLPPAGDYVCVRVCDQGVGIPPAILSKIFEPFFSTKRTGEGTGLGLSTAYGIVKQTGGYIFCDSVEGEGSCFSIYFPAHIGQLADPVDPEPENRPLRGVMVSKSALPAVLLVEDEAPVRAFAGRALQLQGCNVIAASCAEEAMDILKDPGVLIDIIVTDVVMPGMDGPTWVRKALRDRPETRVIFMSGYAEDVFNEGVPPVEGSVFLAKPFSLSQLTDAVAQQLDICGKSC